MARKRNDRCIPQKDGWIRCVQCGHKLGRILENTNNNDCSVEIKCHSCKTINVCHVNIKEE